MSGNKTKKEHYIPRVYLRKFSTLECENNDRKNKLLIYDKSRGKNYISSVYDSACENYFYDLESPSNSNYKKVIEDEFGVIEDSFSKLLNKLINICSNRENINNALIINKKEKIEFSYYIVMQLLRTKKFRDSLTEAFQSVLETRYKCYKVFKEKCLNEEFKIDIDKIREMSSKRGKYAQLEALFDENNINKLIYVISNSCWTFMYNNTSTPFIISDSPICRIPYFIDEYFRDIGLLKSSYVKINYPLSPNIMLFIYGEESIVFKENGKKLNNRLINLDKEEKVHYANKLQYYMAHQKVFINPKNNDLLKKYCI